MMSHSSHSFGFRVLKIHEMHINALRAMYLTHPRSVVLDEFAHDAQAQRETATELSYLYACRWQLRSIQFSHAGKQVNAFGH